MDTRKKVVPEPVNTFAAPRPDGRRRGARQRWHRALAHTADVGFRAVAPDAAGVFEEAAAALAELGADVHTAQRLEPQPVEISAEDLTELMFCWLNELIGLAEIRGEALVRADASCVEAVGADWVVRGQAWFAPFDGTDVCPRLQVKAATLHRLRVLPTAEGWCAEAYFDI
jgi:SHS2 domain-containing protein